MPRGKSSAVIQRTIESLPLYTRCCRSCGAAFTAASIPRVRRFHVRASALAGTSSPPQSGSTRTMRIPSPSIPLMGTAASRSSTAASLHMLDLVSGSASPGLIPNVMSRLEDARKLVTELHHKDSAHEIFRALFSEVILASRSGTPTHYIDNQRVLHAFYDLLSDRHDSVPMEFLRIIAEEEKSRTLLMQQLTNRGVMINEELLTLLITQCAKSPSVDETQKILRQLRLHWDHIQVTPMLAKRWLSLYAASGNITGAMFVCEELQHHHSVELDLEIYQLLLYACGSAARTDQHAIQMAFNIIQHLITQFNQNQARSEGGSAIVSGSEEFAVPVSLFDHLVHAILTPIQSSPSSSLSAQSSGSVTPNQIQQVLAVLDHIKVLAAQHHCPNPSPYVYECIIGALHQSVGIVEWIRKAYDLYKEMRLQYGYLLEDGQLTLLLRAVALNPQLGIEQSLAVLTDRITAYQQSQAPPLPSGIFNALLTICLELKRFDIASLLLEKMTALSINYDLLTYELLIRIYGDHSDQQRLLRIYHSMIADQAKTGLVLSSASSVYQTLIQYFHHDLYTVHCLLKDMAMAEIKPSESLWRAVFALMKANESLASAWLVPMIAQLMRATVSAESHGINGSAIGSSDDSDRASKPVIRMTQSTTAVPHSLTHRANSTAATILSPSDYELPVVFASRLPLSVWSEMMECVAKYRPQPYHAALTLVTVMRSLSLPISRVIYKELVLSRIALNDRDGALMLLENFIDDKHPLDLDLFISIFQTLGTQQNRAECVTEYCELIESVITSKFASHSSLQLDYFQNLFKGLCRTAHPDTAVAVLVRVRARFPGRSVGNEHVKDLLSSISDTSPLYVRQVLSLYQQLATLAAVASIDSYIQLASRCQNNQDVRLLLEAKINNNIPGNVQFYFTLSGKLINETRVDLALLEQLLGIMESENIVLDNATLNQLLILCKFKSLTDVTRLLWQYAQKVNLELEFNNLLMVAQIAAKHKMAKAGAGASLSSKDCAQWIQQVFDRSMATTCQLSVSKSYEWDKFYKSIFDALTVVTPADSSVVNMWRDIAAIGHQHFIDNFPSTHNSFLQALRARCRDWLSLTDFTELQPMVEKMSLDSVKMLWNHLIAIYQHGADAEKRSGLSSNQSLWNRHFVQRFTLSLYCQYENLLTAKNRKNRNGNHDKESEALRFSLMKLLSNRFRYQRGVNWIVSLLHDCHECDLTLTAQDWFQFCCDSLVRSQLQPVCVVLQNSTINAVGQWDVKQVEHLLALTYDTPREKSAKLLRPLVVDRLLANNADSRLTTLSNVKAIQTIYKGKSVPAAPEGRVNDSDFFVALFESWLTARAAQFMALKPDGDSEATGPQPRQLQQLRSIASSCQNGLIERGALASHCAKVIQLIQTHAPIGTEQLIKDLVHTQEQQRQQQSAIAVPTHPSQSLSAPSPPDLPANLPPSPALDNLLDEELPAALCLTAQRQEWSKFRTLLQSRLPSVQLGFSHLHTILQAWPAKKNVCPLTSLLWHCTVNKTHTGLAGDDQLSLDLTLLIMRRYGVMTTAKSTLLPLEQGKQLLNVFHLFVQHQIAASTASAIDREQLETLVFSLLLQLKDRPSLSKHFKGYFGAMKRLPYEVYEAFWPRVLSFCINAVNEEVNAAMTPAGTSAEQPPTASGHTSRKDLSSSPVPLLDSIIALHVRQSYSSTPVQHRIDLPQLAIKYFAHMLLKLDDEALCKQLVARLPRMVMDLRVPATHDWIKAQCALLTKSATGSQQQRRTKIALLLNQWQTIDHEVAKVRSVRTPSTSTATVRDHQSSGEVSAGQ